MKRYKANHVRSQSLWLTIIVLAASVCIVEAQKIELGAGVGGMNYVGDISPNFKFRFIKPAGSIFFRYNPNSALSLRAEALGGLIGAADKVSKDPYQIQRNRSFTSKLMEGSVVAEYNFLDFIERKNALNWSPYVFGGLAFTKFNTTPNDGGYKSISISIPYGVGVKYQIRRPWGIGLEYGTRQMFTDYVDNLGTATPDIDRSQLGNPSLKDKYYYIRFSVTYTFYKIVCP